MDDTVVQRPMRFDVADPGASPDGQRLEGPDLIDDVGNQIRRVDIQVAAAKTDKVAIADVRADGDAIGGGHRQRSADARRVAGMETAGDVRARDRGEHRGVIDRPTPEAFTHVAVEIDTCG
ncbi:hypothetical protein SDC9_112995 [bioreactor metagenome]|uniref:Uncharacterized protein n=1 Tax=bioreactor metagenome TaxID=1076179 RepID=A0A645BLT3_9ZZZZ